MRLNRVDVVNPAGVLNRNRRDRSDTIAPVGSKGLQVSDDPSPG
jgi:hypothetical protein